MRRCAFPLAVVLAGCSATPRPPRREVSLERAEVEVLSGNYGRAARLYEQALPYAGGDRRAEVLLRIGACRLGAGDAAGAVDALGAALSADPTPAQRVEILYRRAAAHNALHEPREALADLTCVRETAAPVRESAVRSEEFAYRLAVTTLRAGDWKGGRALLGDVASRFAGTREAIDAKDRMALAEFRIQVARLREPRGATGDAVPSAAGDYLVLVGRFPRFADAVRELERVRRTGHPDAFVVP